MARYSVELRALSEIKDANSAILQYMKTMNVNGVLTGSDSYATLSNIGGSPNNRIQIPKGSSAILIDRDYQPPITKEEIESLFAHIKAVTLAGIKVRPGVIQSSVGFTEEERALVDKLLGGHLYDVKLSLFDSVLIFLPRGKKS
jgi:hypothetical protein